MNSEINNVLKAVSSNGKFTGDLETAYQLGFMASWINRISKYDWAVSAELDKRIEDSKGKK
jgi:hypothetical protein